MKKIFILSALFLFSLTVFCQNADSLAALKHVDSLIRLSRTLTGKSDFDKALEVNAVAEKIALEQFGRESVSYGSVCFNHGRVLYFIGDFSEAEKWYLESKVIREKVLGKEHPDYAWSLNNLALLYENIRQYEKSEPLYMEVLAIREKILGKEHPDYPQSLSNLAILYYYMGNYKKAEPLYIEALAIRKKILGKEHPDYAQGLNNLAALYSNMGKYEKAESLCIEALAIRKKILGKEHPDYAQTLNNLAISYDYMGNYGKAEPLYIEALAINEKVLGKEHPDYARGLNNLAILYMGMGNYEKAEPLIVEARAIYKKVLGKEHPDYAVSLNNLANLYVYLGNYEKADPLYIEALVIYKKVLGKEHPDYAVSLNNLAAMYKDMGRYERAELLYLEVLSILEKALSKEHPDYATGLSNLAVLYSEMGNLEKAEVIFIESRSIREKVLGKEHFDYASDLHNLAVLYLDMSNYGKSEPLHLESLSIREKTLGKEHPDYAKSLYNLANLYWASKKFDTAEIFLLGARELDKSLLLKASRHLSERELALYVGNFSKGENRSFSFARNQVTQYAFCYDNALFHKGFLLNAISQVGKLALNDSVSAEKYYLFKSCHHRLATQYAQPIAARDSALITDLEQKANTLEKELVRTVAGFGEALRQVTWQEVQQQLRPGEAAIEFVHYNFYTPWPTDSIMYAALVLRPGDTTPHFIPLFEERRIAPLLKGASGGNDRKINALYGIKGQDLFALIWKPLDSLLTGINTVYISPSGLLHRLNLGAIPAPGQQPFGEGRRVITLGSTRQLVPAANYQAPVNAALSAAVFGGIRYETDTMAMLMTDVSDATATRGLAENRSFYMDSTFRGALLRSSGGQGAWNYLPGTRTEALDVAQLLQKARYRAQLDTGYSATEEAFHRLGRGQAAPRILHVATHGFFYPDPKDPVANRSSLFGQENTVFRLSDNPMLRAGLILAGANQAWLTGKGPENREDGILTAYEISHLDLSGTELVVLSACETGLGDIEGNEGVYGLQRAFKIAGAKYLMMSLWKVSDNSTREFMTEFYRLWLEDKQTIPDAFRGAQAFMKKKYPGSPFHWAGFVLVE